MAGRLILVAGPIGNLGDLSPRATEALQSADLVLAEDTRVASRLLDKAEASVPTAVLNEHTSPAKQQGYIDRLQAGDDIVLLTDAGTPAISDPGSSLVDLAHQNDIVVTCLPGPSAVTTALAVSGFYGQQFVFFGFLPRKQGAIQKALSPFADSTMTLVLFESPFRFRQTLEWAGGVLGERRYAVCRELTKLYEQVWRGTLPDLPSEADVPAKGEFTIVIEGLRKQKNVRK